MANFSWTNYAQILTVKRREDNHIFSLGDETRMGVIRGFRPLENEMLVYMTVDPESKDPEVWNLNELELE